jgi:hypothetical protein
MTLLIFFIDTASIALTKPHYIGDIIITSQQQEDALIKEITENAIYGDFNIWKPAYYIKNASNGTILHYAFFSKNKSLPDLNKE